MSSAIFVEMCNVALMLNGLGAAKSACQAFLSMIVPPNGRPTASQVAVLRAIHRRGVIPGRHTTMSALVRLELIREVNGAPQLTAAGIKVLVELL